MLAFLSTVQAETVGMVTGSKTGTYIQFGKQISEVSKQQGVNIEVKESKGSIDNIKRIISTENAAFAIVQSDVLGYLKKSKSAKMKETANKLRMIFPFYNEEIHLFANTSIRSIEDLNGKRVIVGSQGSGTNMTVENLMKIANVKPALSIYDSPKKGVSMVVRGKADAVFYVAGKPVTLFSNLFKTQDSGLREKLSSVHFVPLDDKNMLSEYVRAKLEPEDYNIISKPVPTIAVKAMLISFDFSSNSSPYYKKRCQQLRKIGLAIREGIDNLKQTGHPKWKTVDLGASVGEWRKDKCAHSIASEKTVETLSDDPDDNELKLECILDGGKWDGDTCRNSN